MSNSRWAPPVVLLCALGCASPAPVPPAAPHPVPVETAAVAPRPSVPPPAVASPTRFEAEEFRHALENAYAQIVARTGMTVKPPVVDVEAVVSMPIPQHRTINGALSYFSTGLKDSIQTSLTRSARYKTLIDKALDEYKLPRGLAYLPVIESAYVPTLTSRAGAHGIWQFMPETAREYGLRVDWWVDERADPERSTRAAAAYIKDLYRQFNDWPLALAAYNAGPGRIRRALANTGATTFWDLLEDTAVPRETRGYVPTFFATLMIASDPATYGFRMTEPVKFDEKRVEIEGPLSLAFLAQVARVDENTMFELNPAYPRGLLPPGRSVVRVPSAAADEIAARATTLKNEDARIAVCTFTLRQGYSIKRLAKLLGTKPDVILAMNGLKSASRVHTGDSIYLPLRPRELSAILTHGSDGAFHAVKRGETYYSIAKKYKLTIEELLDLNQLAVSHMLQPGEKLRVKGGRAMTAGGM